MGRRLGDTLNGFMREREDWKSLHFDYHLVGGVNNLFTVLTATHEGKERLDSIGSDVGRLPCGYCL